MPSPVSQLLRNDLEEFANSERRPDELEMALAIYDAERVFQLQMLVRPIHLNDVFNEDLEIWSRSPGLPWTTDGYKTNGDIPKDVDAIKSVRRFWHYVKVGHGISFPDSYAYVQNQNTDIDKTKGRVIWDYPATVTFGEAMFAVPLIRAYQAKEYPIAYGYKKFRGGCTKLSRWGAAVKYYISIEFKKFDKTVPSWLIQVAFAILARNIDFAHYHEYGIPDALQLFKMYNTIMDYFINTSIVTATGLRFRKSSGIASGSYFTQLVGSICKYILINYFNRKMFRVPPDDILVFGDDNVIKTSNKWNLFTVQSFAKHLGLEIDLNKSQVETSINKINFLGYRPCSGKRR